MKKGDKYNFKGKEVEILKVKDVGSETCLFLKNSFMVKVPKPSESVKKTKTKKVKKG